MAEVKYRVSNIAFTFMIGVAILFELLELLVDWIPLIGQVISLAIDIVATMTFRLWFALSGLSFSNPKVAGRFWISNFIELLPIPVLDTGVLLVGVIMTVSASRLEDVTNAKIRNNKLTLNQTKTRAQAQNGNPPPLPRSSSRSGSSSRSTPPPRPNVAPGKSGISNISKAV